MKIAIFGTHGIGKTTLVNTLANDKDIVARGLFAEVVEEDARMVAEKFGALKVDDIPSWPIETREDFQLYMMVSKIAREFQLESFISDRSVLDILAYSIYYKCSDIVIETLEVLCFTHIREYDKLFYAPIPNNFSLTDVDDGFRMTAMESIVDVDFIMQQLFMRYVLCIEDKQAPHKLSANRDTWIAEIKAVLL